MNGDVCLYPCLVTSSALTIVDDALLGVQAFGVAGAPRVYHGLNAGRASIQTGAVSADGCVRPARTQTVGAACSRARGETAQHAGEETAGQCLEGRYAGEGDG